MPVKGIKVIGMDPKSLSMTIHALNQTSVTIHEAGYAAARAAGAILFTEVRKNAMLTDHSPGDLAEMDHPYARRHGKIRADRLGHPGHQIHTRSGAFLRAIKFRAGKGVAPYYDVYLDGAAPHIRYVVQGTRVMLPRDVIGVTSRDPLVKQRMMQMVTLVLGKGLRSQALLRFDQKGTKTVRDVTG